MKSSRWLASLMIAICLISFRWPARASEEIVELRLQRAKCLCGVVTVGNEPVRRARVEEFTSDWKKVLRSTDTNEEGRFNFVSVEGREVYSLQISARSTGVNPLRVPVKVVHFRGVSLLRLQRIWHRDVVRAYRLGSDFRNTRRTNLRCPRHGCWLSA